FESTPAFREALHELEQLRHSREQGLDLAALIKDELKLLEEDIALRTQYIQSLVDKL
ncbi:MAG: hypothetical protein GY896_02270, partial [Gammaproteobacteria bacterium]|nr:hypothetical protein [Gammaproteobacteria bacterium]